MAEIAPFRGLLYDPAVAGALESLVAPPYDVISPAQQDALYEASPHNYVRVILNRAEPGDADAAAPYARAAKTLAAWESEGILREDVVPALYLYQQAFTVPGDGVRKTRTGFFCALTLEPYSAGVVLPHEETRTKAKEDRLRLMQATRSNPEPIFGLYEDPEGETTRALAQPDRAPDLQVTVAGDEHRVWRVADPTAIEAVQAFLRDRRIWIADGHHRYETALAYRGERRGEARGDAPAAYDSILIVLVPFEDPGMVVLPTHRLVKNVSEARLAQLLERLGRYFLVEPTPIEALSARMAAPVSVAAHRFGLVTDQGSWLLVLRDEALMDDAVEGYSDVWKRLDVSILQTLVLERSLDIPAAMLATTPDIGYTRDWDEALAVVRSGEWQIALLLNDPSSDEVRQVAAAGDKMPPKSTFFYPKVWSGLVQRKLD